MISIVICRRCEYFPERSEVKDPMPKKAATKPTIEPIHASVVFKFTTWPSFENKKAYIEFV